MHAQESEACRLSDLAILTLSQAQHDMEKLEKDSDAKLQAIENQKTRAEMSLNDQVKELEQRSAAAGPALYKSVSIVGGRKCSLCL